LDSPQIGFIILVIFLLILSGLFSASETAFSSLNIIRLKQMAKSKNEKARYAYSISKKYTEVITTILVGNNIVNISATSIATYLFAKQFNGSGVLYATVTMTTFILIFGEIIPKVFARGYAEDIVIFMAKPLRLMMILLHPIVFLVTKVENRFIDDEDRRVTATEDELVEIVNTIEMEGVLEQDERELIESAIQFDDKTVREIMRPRDKVVFLYDNATEKQIKDVIVTHKYSRIPVISYEGLHAIGIIRERDVLDALLQNRPISMETLIKPVSYISQRRRLGAALEKLQKSREHMAVVVENVKNMNFVGIVTLEDILEEIVGEIYDEYDDLPRFVVEIGHHTFEIDGIVPIKQFFDDFLEDEKKPNTKAKTFASWVEELAAGTRLRKNRELIYENMALKVLAVKEGRASKIELNVYSRQDDEFE